MKTFKLRRSKHVSYMKTAGMTAMQSRGFDKIIEWKCEKCGQIRNTKKTHKHIEVEEWGEL